MTRRLAQINPSLAREARKVLDVNNSERHIRGGMATREKYLHQMQNGIKEEKALTKAAAETFDTYLCDVHAVFAAARKERQKRKKAGR